MKYLKKRKEIMADRIVLLLLPRLEIAPFSVIESKASARLIEDSRVASVSPSVVRLESTKNQNEK